MQTPNPEKKVDEAWKAEIEKERLKQEQELAQETDSDKKGTNNNKSVDPSFQTLLSSLGMQALVALGEIPVPGTNEKDPNPEQAKAMIGIMEMLQAKTKANLSKGEEDMLSGILYELRMKYVQQTEEK